MKTAKEWLPFFSDQLSCVHKFYPIMVHGIPPSFDTSRYSKDITGLLSTNTDVITCPSTLHHTEFLACTSNKVPPKMHSPLILHFTDPETANKCIDHHMSYRGRLLPAVKYTRHPPQCYNCHRTGHFARSCKVKMSCGHCADE